MTQVGRLEAAVQRLKTDDFDVVLLDLSLPDSERAQTVGSLHSHAPQAAIVVMTGADDEELGLEAVRTGAQDYLVKGQVGPKAITRAIRYAMERKRAETELRQNKDLLELRVRQRTAELERTIAMLGKEVSDRTEAQKDLRENEGRFRLMLDALPTVFWICSPDLSAAHFANPAYETLWGSTCEALYRQPRSWLEAIHPEDRPRSEQALGDWLAQAAYRKLQPLRMEFRVVRPDGAVAWVDASLFAVYNSRREFVHLCCMAHDITEQRPSQGYPTSDAARTGSGTRSWTARAHLRSSFSADEAAAPTTHPLVGRWTRLRSWLWPRRRTAGFRTGLHAPAAEPAHPR